MEILKGQVRDPGYPDCECTYAKMDNGQLYYFIKDGELSNQNIIVTTILKEAIGHTPYTSLGLINSNGDVLIPFENKAITKLDDNLLLVEKNVATTQSVIDAINAKSDPFSATNLVNTANAIKEQMKSVMGYSAEFVFDNQFSEAALYNIQGQNIGGAYFSFIGRDDFGNYYMSSNVLNSQIVKYDPSLVQNQAPPTASTEAPSSSDDVQQQISEAPQDNQISDNTQNNNETFNNVQEETPNQDQQNVPDLGIPNIDIPIQNQVSDNQEQVNNVENQNFETGNNVGDNPDVPLSNGDGETTPENNTSDMVSDAGESENNSISQEVDNDAAATNNDSNDFGIGDSNNVDDATVDDNESDDDSGTEDNDNADDATVDDNESDVDSDTEDSDNADDATVDDNESDDDSGTEDNDNVDDATVDDNESDDDSGTEDNDNVDDATVDDNESDDDTGTEDNDKVDDTTVDDNESDADSDTEDNDNVDDATVDDNESDDDTGTEDNDKVDDTTVDDNESDADSDTEDNDNVDDATVDDNESDDDTGTEDNDKVDDTTVDDNESDDDSDTGNDDENVSNVEEANMDLVDEDITNPVIFNATNTIRKLLDENRSQREVIDHQADELENIKSSNEILLADNNSKEQELRSLRKSMSHFRGQNSSLTRENTKLKSINDRQKEVIENLKHQNQVLKEQVAGISALGSAVAEANTVIGIDDNSSDDSITYDTDLGYLGDSDEVEDK